MDTRNTPGACDENGQSSLVEASDLDTSKAKHLTKTHPLRSFIATACPTAVIRHQNTRSRSRTLSIQGRQAMLHDFRQRRPTQRTAIVDSMLEGLTPQHVEEVYAQVELAKEAHAEKFIKMRELWNRELDWGPRPYWSSDEATWSPELTSSWGHIDKEITGEAVEGPEEDTESVWSCGQDSTFESLTWPTDNDEDDDDGADQPEVCGTARLTPSTGFALPELHFTISERCKNDAESTEDSVAQLKNDYASRMHQSSPEIRCITGANGNTVNTASGALACESMSIELESTPSRSLSQYNSEGAVVANGLLGNGQIDGIDRQKARHPSVSPISAAGLVEELAHAILPFVLDKDEPDFTRTLSEGIDFWYQRGQNYMWQQPAERAKPAPGPSSLRKAWSPEDMALDDTKSSYDW